MVPSSIGCGEPGAEPATQQGFYWLWLSKFERGSGCLVAVVRPEADIVELGAAQ